MGRWISNLTAESNHRGGDVLHLSGINEFQLERGGLDR